MTNNQIERAMSVIKGQCSQLGEPMLLTGFDLLDIFEAMKEEPINTKAEKKSAVSHPPYVGLTKDQGIQLCKDFGKSIIVDYIQRINDYLAGNKGKDTYKDHSAVIRNWLRRDKIKKQVAIASHITNEMPKNRYVGSGKGFEDLTKGIGGK